MSVRHVKNRPILIGLTGGIASGKSTAARYFESLNIPVIDSDLIVKHLWLHQHDMLDQIETVFHTLDKKVIATTIFSNEILRETLNGIVHPYVFLEIARMVKSLKDETMLVIDMPLLFEVGYQDQVDYTAVVCVNKEIAIKRVMARDHLSFEEASKRVASQMPIEEKCEKADYILDNQKDKETLYKAIDHMLGSILDEE